MEWKGQVNGRGLVVRNTIRIQRVVGSNPRKINGGGGMGIQS